MEKELTKDTFFEYVKEIVTEASNNPTHCGIKIEFDKRYECDFLLGNECTLFADYIDDNKKCKHCLRLFYDKEII